MCCVFFECRRGEYSFLRFLGCLCFLMIFVVSGISLILPLFLSSIFCNISVNSSELFLL